MTPDEDHQISSPGNEDTPNEQQKIQIIPFPIKLLELLENEPSDVISWTPSGFGFIVKSTELFSTHVLPRYFRRM